MVKVKVMVNVMMVVLMAVEKKQKLTKGRPPKCPQYNRKCIYKRMVPMKRTWQRNRLPSSPPSSHNLLDKEAEQEHHVPVKRNRDMKEKKSSL